jgi:hypothetical protein
MKADNGDMESKKMKALAERRGISIVTLDWV